MSISENIKRRMEETGVSQVKLSEVLGCSQPYVSAIVNGEKIPALFAAVKIADTLGCTVDDLVK